MACCNSVLSYNTIRTYSVSTGYDYVSEIIVNAGGKLPVNCPKTVFL